MKIRLLLITYILFLNYSCTTNGTNWDVDLIAPIAEANLTLNNMVGQDNLDIATDSSVKLHINTPVYTFNLDTVQNVPPFNYVYNYVWTFGSVSISPGFTMPNIGFDVNVGLNDIKLRKMDVDEGKLKIRVKYTTTEDLIMTYIAPKVKFGGVPLSFTDTLKAKPSGVDTAIYTKEFSLDNYEMDLTGVDGTQTNTFKIDLYVSTPSSNNPLPISSGQTVLSVVNEITELKPKYGLGYLGKYDFSQDNVTTNLDFMNILHSGVIDVDNIWLDLSFHNYIGAEVKFKPNYFHFINTMNATNIPLMHSSIGSTTNINRATQTGASSSPVTPYVHHFIFHSGNSNIEAMLESIPNKIEFSADAELNPYGNISGYNDFYYSNYPSFINLELITPFKYQLSDILLIDTIENPFENLSFIDPVKTGLIKLNAENKFPLEILLQFYTLNETGFITDSVFINDIIQAGSVNSTGRVEMPTNSSLDVLLNPTKIKHLKEANSIKIVARFNTLPSSMGTLQMYIDYYLNLKIIGNVTYNIEL